MSLIRYAIARFFIHLALNILPEGVVKKDLYKMLKNYGDHIKKVIKDSKSKEVYNEYTPKEINNS